MVDNIWLSSADNILSDNIWLSIHKVTFGYPSDNIWLLDLDFLTSRICSW